MKKTRRITRVFRAGQQGSAMILVLIFMALAGLVVPPMLSYMTTGLATGMIFEENTKKLYAAESGVTDGLWYVSYGDVAGLFGETYKPYDFTSTWTYSINETLNGQSVEVTVQNIWMPQNIPVPPEPEASSIIETGKLLLTSTANSTSNYAIEASFYPDSEDELLVESLGIWLPPGFNYVPGSSNLEDDPGASYYPTYIQVIPWASGEAVIWHFASVPFDELGPLIDCEHLPLVSTIGFNYTSVNSNALPGGIAWMTTSGVDDVPYTWDANNKVYRIEATAADETVEVYATRSEMRQLGAAVKGDYCAIGNVLETATGNPHYRNRLLRESSATVETGEGSGEIPVLATIRDAWLYWSGWVNDGHDTLVWSDDCSELSTWQTVWQDDCDELSTWQTVWQDDCDELSTWQTVWQDSCSNFDNWNNGSAWDIYNGDFRGHYDSGGDPARYLTMSASVDLEPYQGQTVRISWDQQSGGDLESYDVLWYSISKDGGSTWPITEEAFHGNYPPGSHTYTIPGDYLTSGFRIRFYLDGFSGSYGGTEYAFIDNIEIEVAGGGWTAGSDWDVYYGEFRGHHSYGHSEDDRYLTQSASVDLEPYQGQTVRIAWEQDSGGDLESYDVLRFSISKDGGSTWPITEVAFSNDNPPSSHSYTIPGDYLTSGFRIRFYLDGFNDGGYPYGDEYAYIDDIEIAVASGGWTAGSDWDVHYGEFRGHHSYGHSEDDRYLTMSDSLDLTAYWGTMMTISWDQDEEGNLGSGDGLRFAVSKDGGANWTPLMNAFHDDHPSSPHTYTIPNDYLTSGFKIRFHLDGMTDSGDYAFIDDITITQSDMGVDRVVFNGVEVTAQNQQFKENTNQGDPTGTWSYSCSYDATNLVKQMIADEELGSNGSGAYTVGHILEPREGDPGYSFTLYPSGTTGYPLAIPSGDAGIWGQYTYAAWSLILIYTSPETLGHQIYLYDDFDFVENAALELPVSGFLAPNDTTGSSATFFVGEGDYGYTSDGVKVNGYSLSDGINPANNVWNSYSNALDDPYINGIDLDTFDISEYVDPGDTSAEIELYTNLEIVNSIYVILSFRNDSEFGGVISFLISD
jgi:hypothetical protein